FSPTGESYVDVLTESDLPPVATLHHLPKSTSYPLVTCDIGRLEAIGYTQPQRFHLKGADGSSDIYGIILMPTVAQGEKLRLVEYIYGGNQTAVVPHTFYSVLQSGFIQSLAALGLAVIVIDGRGTPLRGKSFHDHCYQNQGACAGIEDHVAVIRQLAQLYPQLDCSQIGVWGHSGGGFATLHCMVKYPDLYAYGLSSGGNHAQEIYTSHWSERYMGTFDPQIWDAQRAEHLVANLTGKLFLLHGEMDDNVHPASTMRIVDALIKADKDFEFLIMPNLHHALRPSPYYRRKILEFFNRHLLEQ
ncbi:MAG: S9 family peptidase, partial [Symbiobacteriaceae bacterium]|nr:S9 family peptidase [Symbiobacteriaceae bacterium]